MNNKEIRAKSNEILNSIGHYTLSKFLLIKLYEKYGGLLALDSSILFSELETQERYFAGKNELTKEGFFFTTQQFLKDKTTLSPSKQRKALTVLEEENLVITKKQRTNTTMSTKYYRINHAEILSWNSQNNNSQCAESENQENNTKNKKCKSEEFEHYNVKNVNTNNKRLNNNILSKDNINNTSSEVVDDSIKKKNLIENKLITYYNELPNVRKHKNIESKIYDNINRSIKRLKKGTFGNFIRKQHMDVLDEAWFKKNNLNQWMDHKFTEEEIKSMMNSVNLYFNKDYAPNSEKKGLDIMFFNPQTGKSLALWLFQKPPVKKSGMVTTQYPQITKIYAKKAFSDLCFSAKEQREFIIAVNRFVKTIEEMKAVFKSYNYQTFYMDGFYQRHAEWIRDKVKTTASPSHILSTTNGFWSSFKVYFRKETGVNLEPTERELNNSKSFVQNERSERKQIKRAEERVKRRAFAEEAGINVKNTELDPRLDSWETAEIAKLFQENGRRDLTPFFPDKEDEDDDGVKVS